MSIERRIAKAEKAVGIEAEPVTIPAIVICADWNTDDIGRAICQTIEGVPRFCLQAVVLGLDARCGPRIAGRRVHRP